VAFVFAALVVLFALALAAQPARAEIAKGMVDHRLQYSDRVPAAEIPAYADEVAATGATWTRVFVRWNYLQPQRTAGYAGDADRDGYSDHYVAELDAVIQALHERGLKIMLCGNDIPVWAANPKYCKGRHLTSAVIRSGSPTVMAEFQQFAEFLAGHFRQWGVRHFEVWNEPNLSSGIYPQVVGKTAVGPAAYIRMLKAFYKGAHAENPRAVVIAGATSRFGSPGTNESSTSPQWFAGYLKAQGATKWFNAYSHHPYTKLGSDPRPSVPPKQPRKAVTLGNIDVLLKIFPGKPFYLTEFCYSTALPPKQDLFCVAVSEADQARYLRQAWAFCEKVNKKNGDQIKAMFWFLVRDWEKDPVGLPGVGVYTGLLDPLGVRKPSWYAFVGGNELTASAPASVAAGEDFIVSGSLTTGSLAGAGVTVLLQRAPLVGGSWSTVTTAVTSTDVNGDCAFTVSQTQGARYRVVWDGVCESAPLRVDLQ
jgi:hypothetical protein